MPLAGPSHRHYEVRGVRVPALIYGTAWKEGRTARLTQAALEAGFRGIDTANQRRHYHEAAVGEALCGALGAGKLRRADLFVQTKFTYIDGQDHRVPYDPRAPVEEQVEQSFAKSLEHLGVAHIDAYLLHGPYLDEGLADEDWRAWGAMERLQRAGRTRLIGVSNVTSAQLEALHSRAAVKPAIVQNRCFARPHADERVRRFCREQGILYQGFSLLTARRSPIAHPQVLEVAERLGATPAQVVLAFALHQGLAVLSGTTSPAHMADDLAVPGICLETAEVEAIERLVR